MVRMMTSSNGGEPASGLRPAPAGRVRETLQPQTADALVVARGVSRVYRQRHGMITALLSATCRVAPGDRIALVGPSGSGKSTLLHLMAGLDVPTSGTISWPALGAREALRPAKVAIVFQMPSLLPWLSVVENVELPLVLASIGSGLARAAALDAMARMDLVSLANRLPDELSGGQAQRVAMARALAPRPPLILADEPTGQLDRRTAMDVLDALSRALTGTSAAVVVATHDSAVAERMTTVWRIDHGTLEVLGP
jgi:ABC-type lipoprotein export system ATPase subunit